ncbi:MAG TPA: hypothetical protein PLV92_25430, partial [Pirellulaceae bacterium]|nr:hypothetical protein [Pirellulaceae bacterium]
MSAACDREPSMELSDFREELSPLWERTRGSSDVCIAVLDGPVDLTHPCFRGADLTVVESQRGAERLRRGPVGGGADHGTLVASLLFGQPGSP